MKQRGVCVCVRARVRVRASVAAILFVCVISSRHVATRVEKLTPVMSGIIRVSQPRKPSQTSLSEDVAVQLLEILVTHDYTCIS